MTPQFTALHLFSGIGGGALGFQQARGDWMGVPGAIKPLGGTPVWVRHPRMEEATQ